ncbi:hypothetical protein [Kordiimonas pumila]|uniref:Uncharacterized protein n=1 Tax=Kordiimonas pumila TaxID=2161677 RepID=A0ABV7D8F7_9PROT|nr:hypothetical protein [Kordiimonas pumila]
MSAKVWIDGYDYAVGLLRAGGDPWGQPDGMGLFCGEVLKLLSADYFMLPVAPLLQKHMTQTDGDPEDIAEALNDAVEDGALLGELETAIASLSANGVLSNILLVLPGPATAVLSNSDEDAMDLASLALGDILRKAGSASIVQIGLDEKHTAGLQMASSMFRIADHFGLSVAVLNHQHGEQAAKAFPAADSSELFAQCQTIGPDAFKSGGAVNANAMDVRIMIPADSNPEFVLSRIKDLKEGA